MMTTKYRRKAVVPSSAMPIRDEIAQAGAYWTLSMVTCINRPFRCEPVVRYSRARKQLSPSSRLKDSRLFSACEAQ